MISRDIKFDELSQTVQNASILPEVVSRYPSDSEEKIYHHAPEKIVVGGDADDSNLNNSSSTEVAGESSSATTPPEFKQIQATKNLRGTAESPESGGRLL